MARPVAALPVACNHPSLHVTLFVQHFGNAGVKFIHETTSDHLCTLSFDSQYTFAIGDQFELTPNLAWLSKSK